MNRSAEKRVFPVLDGLRGFAILLVISYHYFSALFPVMGLYKRNLNPFHIGWSGVDLFFVISGFLITTVLISPGAGKITLRRFFTNRVLRIVPLYYLFLAVLCVGCILNITSYSLEILKELPYHALFLTNLVIFYRGKFLTGPFNHLWSLSLEVQFYLLFPLVLKRMSLSRLFYASILVVVLSPFIRGYCLEFPSGEFFNFVFTLSRMDTFALGVVVAISLHTRLHWNQLLKYRRSLGGLASLFLIGIYLWEGSLLPMSQWMSWVGYSSFAVLYTCFLVEALFWSELEEKMPLLDSMFLKKIGQLSYGMYLLHPPINALVMSLIKRINYSSHTEHVLIACMGFIVYFCVLIVFAGVSWVLIEKPFLRLKTVPQLASLGWNRSEY